MKIEIEKLSKKRTVRLTFTQNSATKPVTGASHGHISTANLNASTDAAMRTIDTSDSNRRRAVRGSDDCCAQAEAMKPIRKNMLIVLVALLLGWVGCQTGGSPASPGAPVGIPLGAGRNSRRRQGNGERLQVDSRHRFAAMLATSAAVMIAGWRRCWERS